MFYYYYYFLPIYWSNFGPFVLDLTAYILHSVVASCVVNTAIVVVVLVLRGKKKWTLGAKSCSLRILLCA